MLNVTSPQTTTIMTYASPRSAPRPRVIPLFATTLRRRHRRTLSIHTTLAMKPLYHPYPRHKRGAWGGGSGSNQPGDSTTTQSTTTQSTTTQSSSESSAVPVSPLTPMADEFPSDGSPQVVAESILIPPPDGPLSMSSLNAHSALVKDYRAVAKAAIMNAKLDLACSLSEQDPKLRESARDYIESHISYLKNHQDHWGADVLLRDQLKSMRDTKNRKKKKQREEVDELIDSP